MSRKSDDGSGFDARSRAFKANPTIEHYVTRTAIPDWVRDQFLLADETLAAKAEASAVLWTDFLAQEAWTDAVHVIAPVFHIVVDVERYPCKHGASLAPTNSKAGRT